MHINVVFSSTVILQSAPELALMSAALIASGKTVIVTLLLPMEASSEKTYDDGDRLRPVHFIEEISILIALLQQLNNNDI